MTAKLLCSTRVSTQGHAEDIQDAEDNLWTQLYLKGKL